MSVTMPAEAIKLTEALRDAVSMMAKGPYPLADFWRIGFRIGRL